MAQDTTPAIVIYRGNGDNTVPYDVPFDKGYYGEVKVAFIRRGLDDYTYEPDTYTVNGRLYAWVNGTGYIYTHTPNPAVGAETYNNFDEDTGETVTAIAGQTITVDGTVYTRAVQHDIANQLQLYWTGTVLTPDDFICIVRDTERGQPYTFPNNQKHIEGALDNIERQVQENKDKLDNALLVDPSHTTDTSKMNPIDWMKSIIRCVDFSVRALRYANGWLDYSLDDPNKADADKTWIHVLNTDNVKRLYDVVTIDPDTSEEIRTLYYEDSDGNSHKIFTSINLDDLTDVEITNPQHGEFMMYDGAHWVNNVSSGTVGWGAILGNISDQSDLMNKFTEYVRTDGTSVMTAPLLMRATDDFKCAIAPYWDGVGFFKLNNNNSVTLIASLEYQDSFAPAENNVYNIGSTLKKWKNLYLAGKAYVATINNGGDIVVPTSAGTMALMRDVAFKSTDVELTTPSAGEFLRYDGTKWVNSSDAYADTNLSNLSEKGQQRFNEKQNKLTAGIGINIGLGWTDSIANANLGSNTWQKCVYDGSKFVAISFTGYISTSTDGINWSAAVQNTELGSNMWKSIAYNGSKFVALGRDGYISTSLDGETWTTATQNSNLGSNYWGSVVYDGTKFVALGNDGYVSTSADGETWDVATQNSDLGSNNTWGILTYDGTKILALSFWGKISTSTDGTTWTQAVRNKNIYGINWHDVSWDGEKFVAIGQDGYISTSVNGTDWEVPIQSKELGEYNWNAVVFDARKFVAISSTGRVSTSLDVISTKDETNCITEIPQDIKLELNAGTLTVKAGSKTYVPNGVDTFDELVLANDLTYGPEGSVTEYDLLYIRSDSSRLDFHVNSTSGTTAPSGSGFFWNTNTNTIKYYNSGTESTVQVSIPIARVHRTNGTWDKIDQVFNGFGYMGSTEFALPGVKGLIPSGKNADGTLINTVVTVDSVWTHTDTGSKHFDIILYTDHIGNSSVCAYDKQKNYNYNTADNTIIFGCVAGHFNITSGVISNFNPKAVFNALDYNDSEYIAHQAMPSTKYDTLTLGASGSSYTAPADGWFVVAKASGTSGAFFNLQNTTTKVAFTSDGYQIGLKYITIPASKGDIITCSYSFSGTTTYFIFVYANGAK